MGDQDVMDVGLDNRWAGHPISLNPIVLFSKGTSGDQQRTGVGTASYMLPNTYTSSPQGLEKPQDGLDIKLR